jgi:hypothetical protein
MILIWAKFEQEVIVGEITGQLLNPRAVVEILNPMNMQYVQMQAGSKIHGGGAQVTYGIKLVPLPCSKIFPINVSYLGPVIEGNDVFKIYHQILDQIKAEREATVEEAPIVQ